jgi:SAM-dependent methyltransferase
VSYEFEARFFHGLLATSRDAARRVLVVGCGDGAEAGHIAAATGAAVVALDPAVDARARRPGLLLLRADARRLPFRDGMFGALYCYHVLEHVPGPDAAVAEARRVLAPAGLAFFGTPNRSRLLGYLGGRATTAEKVWWNLVDWGRRLAGRWSNELGAHAGFTDRELRALLGRAFGHVESVSQAYYRGKYPGLAALWQTTFQLGLDHFVVPSVYFVATGVGAAESDGGPAAGRGVR